MREKQSQTFPFMEFDKFSLRTYTAKEVQKLAAVQITNLKTFDALGFPLPNGLYDSRLGPSNLNDTCVSCRLPGKQCPGHYGYIHFDVPTFHPVLFPFMYKLMKGSCIHCHRFMCDTKSAKTGILLAQLRCIELGLVSRAEALHNQIAERLGNAESPEENKSLMNAIAIDIKEIDEKIATLVGKSIDELKAESAAPTKNAMDLRNSLMTEYLKTCLFRSRTICPLCKGRNATLRNDENSSLILDFGAKGASKMSRAKMPKKLEEKLDEGPIEEYMEEAAELTGVADDNGVMMANAKIPLREMIDAVTSNKVNKLCWRGAEVREHFRLLWKKEGHVLKKLFAVFDSDETCPMDCLFFEVMLVPPSRYRPIRFLRGENFEDSQTQSFRSILDANNAVICTRLAMDPNREDTFVDQYKIEYERKLRGRDMVEKLHYAYLNLQKMVNNLYDAPPTMKNPSTGIRHLLEKKEGLFRMHMMGKRVNYACRSVITPDPYLDVDEIGIPEIFAKKLTFPAAVSGLNIAQMRKAIESGPENYPGANFISNTGLSDHKNILHKDSRKERLQHSRLLQATVKNSPAVATVFRHLLANEMLLMNRQPSLHKPSIMGHRTRIIRGQRALRMNYAPCKAYNADFDGDEMNGHFIQNTIGQVEAREIANVGSSYLVPKDGTPILGLIQDHVVSGVLLTLRDTFLSKKDFTHLVFAAMGRFPGRIKIPPPSIIHPEKLWTGKQVITAIVRNCIPDGAHLINLQGKAKTSINCWKFGDLPAPKFEMSESEVIFSRGALVNGVLDKAHYGATQYGLIHCCYELYGHKFHGFSLGVADILVQPAANKERNKIVKQLRLEGDNAAKKAFNLDDDATTAQIKHACAKAYNNNKKDKNDVKMLDFTLKQFLGKHSTNLNNVCVPKGLIRSFPQNSLQLMIQSGAKGSMVNAIQISCALGQIELEGKRPGVSVSGRSLPSFKAFDTTPRAGGFIDQRFLTGICPQELFFHTMAGREGLIDTAVKTSRSGYLQRCIIKHLEGIVACYDGTVRDHDGSVIQFKYGEDGLDVGRATFLNPKQFSFLGRNAVAVSESSIPKEAREEQFNLAEMQKAFRKIKRRLKKNKFATKRIFKSGFTEFSKNYPGMDNKAIVNLWFQMTVQEREEWHESSESAIPDPVDSKFNIFRTLGALPEKMLLEVEDYVEKNDLTDDKLKKALFWKGLRSRVEPGENVGLLAAQSIGEPSTQMTLNTFHFAGRGEMNVTLGIPRLREILMTFGTNIATPSSEARLLDDATPERIEKLKRKFNRVYLSQCVKAVRVEERISVTGLGADRCYVIGVEVSKSKNRDVDARHVSRDKVIRSIENGFIRQVCSQINKMEREMQNFDAFVHRKLKAGNDMIEDGAETSNRNDEQSSDEEVEAGENDAAEARLRNRHLDDAAEYEGEDADAAETAAKSDQGIEASFFQMKEDDSDEELDGANDENEAAADLELSGTIESRKNRILNAIPQCSDYSFDVKGNKWCIYTLMLPLNRNKIDVNMVVRNVVDNYVVHQTEKVEKCVIREETHNGKEIKILQTQGINMDALYDSSDVLDVNSIYSNDLNMMLQKYGVEACNRGIVKEMNNVFGVYGIDVSPRHLTLVADYMTYTGRIAPFSRTAMASSTSPLQKMTFETTMTFMRDTLIGGYDDYLVSPSARIVTGQLIRGGTGLFKIRGDTYHCEQPKTVAESVTKISRVINFNSSEDSD